MHNITGIIILIIVVILTIIGLFDIFRSFYRLIFRILRPLSKAFQPITYIFKTLIIEKVALKKTMRAVIVVFTPLSLLVCGYINIFYYAKNSFDSSVFRQEDRVKELKEKFNNYLWKENIPDLIAAQQTTIPYKPLIEDPISIFKSSSDSYRKQDIKTIKDIQLILLKKKKSLSQINLDKVNLSDLDYDENKYGIGSIRFYQNESLNFSKSNFSESSLVGSKAIYANFAYSNFSYTTMSECDFTKSNLVFIDLTNANLERAVLYNSILIGANLQRANLYSSDLRYALLIGANLEGSRGLNSSNLEGAKYNSLPIKPHPLLAHSYNNTLAACKWNYKDKPNNKPNIDRCVDMSMSNIISLTNIDVKETKFPPGFNPKEHGMIDISEVLQEEINATSK